MEGLVKDVQSMLACALRLHMSNEAVLFWNASREFRMMLRNEPLDPSTVAFEVCIVPDDDDDDDADEDEDNQSPLSTSKVLEMEHDGCYDEGLFVVETYSFPMDELVRRPEMLEDARAKVNQVYNYAVCKCRSYLIKDGAKSCLFCQLTDDAGADSTEHFCAICHDSSSERYMAKQGCCGQMLHRACLAVWSATSKDARCPLCRRGSNQPPPSSS